MLPVNGLSFDDVPLLLVLIHEIRPPDPGAAALAISDASAAVQGNLWSEELGIFANKFSQNGTFYPRISPKSFYPMLAGIATDAQAATMVTRWLLNASRFTPMA